MGLQGPLMWAWAPHATAALAVLQLSTWACNTVATAVRSFEAKLFTWQGHAPLQRRISICCFCAICTAADLVQIARLKRCHSSTLT
eukprot:6105869-Amphidinium_carterae.1